MLGQMILQVTFIELIAGFGYLFGHLLLSKNELLGWPVKIIGGIFWIIFLMQHENYIFMAVTTVVTLTMFYGLYKWVKNVKERTFIDEGFNYLSILTGVFVVCWFLISGSYEIGDFIETLIIITEILGTILIARKVVFGWYSFIAMSLLVFVLVSFVNPQPAIILGILEMMSIYFYIKGIKNFKNIESYV